MTNPFYKLNETLANIGKEQDKIAEQVAKAQAEVKSPARVTLEESLKQDMKALMEGSEQQAWQKKYDAMMKTPHGRKAIAAAEKDSDPHSINKAVEKHFAKVKEDGTGGLVGSGSGSLEEKAGYSAKKAAAGKDIGKPGKNFAKIEKSAAKKYGSKEAGEKVAGAVLNKLRHAKESVEEANEELANEGGYTQPIRDKMDAAGGIHGKFPDPMSQKDQHKKMNPPASLEEDDMMEFIKSKLAPAKTHQYNGSKHSNAHGGLEFEDGHKPAWLTAAQKRAERAQGADVEEGIVGQAAGTIAGGALGGPVGAAIGGAIGNNLSNEEESLEETVSRKHFQQVADLLRNIPDEAKRKEMALHHASIFAQQNPRFDMRRFGQAAGVDLEECAMWEELKGGQKNLDRNHDGKLSAQDFAMLRKGTEETDEGWDDAMALGKAAANQKPAFSRHDVKDTGYSKVYTRKPETFDEPEGGEVDPNAPKRGRGRPALNKAPAAKYTTKNATGARKPKTEEVDEETAEAGKRHFFDKLAPAAKKVAKVVSKVTTGKKEEKKEAPKKTSKPEAKKEAPKKEEKVEENTTAGSVAPSAATHPAASAMGVGQGVYESWNRQYEKVINEAVSIKQDAMMDEHAKDGDAESITITATGDDVGRLKELLAGMGIDHGAVEPEVAHDELCHTCGGVPCQCDDMGDVEVVGLPDEVEFEVDEAYGDTTPTENDELSWPTNQMTTGINQSTDPISNDLNKNKTSGQEVGAVTPVHQVKEADESASFLNLYKAFAKIK